MAIEIEPSQYKNRHYKAIHLDTYRGVARDLMHLNNPVADGFMRVSDMRDDAVPLDRLVRGVLYLHEHGRDLIKTTPQNRA